MNLLLKLSHDHTLWYCSRSSVCWPQKHNKCGSAPSIIKHTEHQSSSHTHYLSYLEIRDSTPKRSSLSYVVGLWKQQKKMGESFSYKLRKTSIQDSTVDFFILWDAKLIFRRSQLMIWNLKWSIMAKKAQKKISFDAQIINWPMRNIIFATHRIQKLWIESTLWQNG